MSRFFRGWPRRIVGWVRFYLFGPDTSIEPVVAPSSPDDLHPLMVHVHQWGPCKWNGQYWYSLCLASESCGAKRAC